jgi:hypothetical protein
VLVIPVLSSLGVLPSSPLSVDTVGPPVPPDKEIAFLKTLKTQIEQYSLIKIF